jgi:hypothetical protein
MPEASARLCWSPCIRVESSADRIVCRHCVSGENASADRIGSGLIIWGIMAYLNHKNHCGHKKRDNKLRHRVRHLERRVNRTHEPEAEPTAD